ncbi:hypothetical protein KUTeg_010876 [Tegillarca granosa]|uniref:Uncharacterized protein n=1 Tax=Tegillarca granosa TaxID=220873 RepID=A0ABQ9F4L5_TEGGR|nr:hypothetical protein KUTeg_010876 [Tegillarca granosa]
MELAMDSENVSQISFDGINLPVGSQDLEEDSGEVESCQPLDVVGYEEEEDIIMNSDSDEELVAAMEEIRDHHMAAYYWMNYLIEKDHLQILHKLNNGKEVRIGNYPVDGLVPLLHLMRKLQCFNSMVVIFMDTNANSQ